MKKVLDYFKENKWIICANIFVVLAIIVLCIVTPIDNFKHYYVDRYNSAGDSRFEVNKDNFIIQNFSSRTGKADEIELHIEADNDNGAFVVSIKDINGQSVQDYSISKKDIPEDGWLNLKLDKALKKGDTYFLYVIGEELSKEDEIRLLGIGDINQLHKNKAIEYNGIYISKLDDTLNGCVYIALSHTYVNYFAWVSFCIIIVALNFLWVIRNKEIDKYCFSIIMLFGMSIFLIMSPGSGPDENYHYNSVVKLSNELIGKEDVNVIAKDYVFDYDLHYNTNDNFVKLISGAFQKRSPENIERSLDNRTSVQVIPSNYIAQSMGYSLAYIMHFNGVTCYLFAKFFNLLSYAIMMTFAIRILPIKKELFLLLAISPMAIHQAISLSYDIPIIGLSAIFVALIIRIIIEQKEVTWNDVLIFSILSICFNFQKPCYYFHVLLLFTIPYKQFKSKIDKYLKLGGVVVAYIFVFVLNSLLTPATIVNTLSSKSQGGSFQTWLNLKC